MRDPCHTICLLELDEPLERVIAAQLGLTGYRTERGDSLAAVATAEPRRLRSWSTLTR